MIYSKPKTKKEALDQCLILWQYIEKNDIDASEKEYTSTDVLGYIPLYGCPACEFTCERNMTGRLALVNCENCPLWDYHGSPYMCEHQSGSPYIKYCDGIKGAAGDMVQLIKDKMEVEING